MYYSPSLFTNRNALEADLRYPIWDLVPILGRPSFPRQFVTEKESVTVYLTDRSIDRSFDAVVVEAEGSPRKLLSRDFEGIPIGVGLLSLSRVRASSFSRSFKLRYFAEVDETRDTIIARYLRRDFFIFFDLIFFRNPSRFFLSLFIRLPSYRCTVIICLEEEVERWAAGPTIVQISTNGIVCYFAIENESGHGIT